MWSAETVHEPLVSVDEFEAAQAMFTVKKQATSRTPIDGRLYQLSGLLHCSLCTRRMQGQWNHNRAYYRCKFPEDYPIDEPEHPRSVYVREDERGDEVVAGVRRAADAPAHPRIRPVVLDVTDAAQLAAAAKDVGQLSGLINNAGVAFAGPMEHLPLDRLREQLEVNIVGLVAATQAFLPAIRAGRGRVVMIGSTAGQVATPFLGAYSASKFALEAISDALRQELRPWRVPVVIIEPGSFLLSDGDGGRLNGHHSAS